MSKTKLTAEEAAEEIFIQVDNDYDVTSVTAAHPDHDGLVRGGEFKSKAAAEAHAEKETQRLRKLGYTAVEWGANY